MTKIFDRFLEKPENVTADLADDPRFAGAAPSETGPEGAPPSPADHSWITGLVESGAGPVPVVATRLGRADRLGTILARLSINRMSYSVRPGLYAVGRPDPGSPVFVTANYKMSFDHLRRALDGRDGWILVLDTFGINVWCAAGKGTFGTDELVKRIEAAGLARVVSHRKIVLPQLGAPGIAAHEVARRTGFQVIYGPVRAADLAAFLDAGLKASPEMRLARFGFRDRIILTPVEIVIALTHKVFLATLAAWIVGILWIKPLAFSLPALLGAILIGALVVPALLPWIPVRPFSLKGWLAGLAWTIGFLALRGLPASAAGWLASASYLLVLPALSAFIAMGFTGSSPVTSLSGVVKEMKTAVPLMVLAFVLGAAATIASFVV
jgi:hypothetical protein